MSIEFQANALIRYLSSVYVYIWIPIRLNYLRLKIKLQPAIKVAFELVALIVLILTTVPSSLLYIISQGIEGLTSAWIQLLCSAVEQLTGIESERLYDCVLNYSLPEDEDIPEERAEDIINESDRSTVAEENVNETSTEHMEKTETEMQAEE